MMRQASSGIGMDRLPGIGQRTENFHAAGRIVGQLVDLDLAEQLALLRPGPGRRGRRVLGRGLQQRLANRIVDTD